MIKHFLLLVPMIPFIVACKGQNNDAKTYTQKLEYGINGPVKEITTYVCAAQFDTIAADTSNYLAKHTQVYSKNGDALESYNVYRPNNDTSMTVKRTFLGKGKAVSFKETTIFADGEIQQANFEYVWLDDFNYKIVEKDKKDYISLITLDKNFAFIKSAYKNDHIGSIESIETIYKGNRKEKIISLTTVKRDGKTEVITNVQVLKKHDRYFNPTLIYTYSDVGETQLENVVLKIYKYY